MNRSNLSRIELDVIHVGNLPLTTSQEELQQLFGQFGEIHSLWVIIEEDTIPTSCCGWIYMRQAETATQALDQADFKGRRISVRRMGTFIPLENPRAA